MKNVIKLAFCAIVINLTVASCGNSNSNSSDTDSDTSSIIDSMPEDNSASGDTAVVVDSVQ